MMSKALPVPDYANSGLTIQGAMLDLIKRFPDKNNRPNYILWNGRQILTGDSLAVPAHGVVRVEILSSKGDVEQGFDLKLDGWIRLKKGETVSLLRTWNDPRYEAFVEYPFQSNNGRLWVWNVYKMRYPGGQIVEERWTENAGMWVEVTSSTERVYHCSHGMAHPPDFESLVFKIAINP
jgi:hypothetical protein